MRIKQKDIARLRDEIAAEQGHKCWLCHIDLRSVMACLDHNHNTGAIRGVLCQNCNGIEGKIFNLTRRAKRNMTSGEYLTRIQDYWRLFTEVPRDLVHPSHKFEDEKRAIRNKKARLRRKKKKDLQEGQGK